MTETTAISFSIGTMHCGTNAFRKMREDYRISMSGSITGDFCFGLPNVEVRPLEWMSLNTG